MDAVKEIVCDCFHLLATQRTSWIDLHTAAHKIILNGQVVYAHPPHQVINFWGYRASPIFFFQMISLLLGVAKFLSYFENRSTIILYGFLLSRFPV